MIARLVLGLAIGTGVIFCTACVTSELRAMQEAEARYENCVAERSAAHAECESLHASYLEAQRRYEENARRAWSCDPATEECPTPR